jgi:hypothetical protein
MLRILGTILIVAGLAGLAVGTFSYTETKDVVKVGPINVQAKEKESVTIPRAAALGAAAIGAVLVVIGRKK